MNQDDESFLSAYLDGELDPREQQAVESALLSDPKLSERLRALVVVRDLVAGLPRTSSPRDLSEEICRKIGGRRPSQLSVLGGRTFSRIRVRAVGLAAAATVLMTLAVGMFSARLSGPPDAPGRVPLASASAPASPVASKRDGPAPAPVSAPAPTPVPASPALAARSLRPQPRPVRNAPEEPIAPGTNDERLFRQMLDNPSLRKVFFVTDVIGGRAERTVGTLLEATPRIEARFGRITISQGIVIDPGHPQRATVFAVAMTEHELSRLRGDLRKAFPGAVEETAPDPSVVTQLADVGGVALFPGTAVASLEPPPDESPRLARKVFANEDAAEGPSGASAPAAERKASAPAPFPSRIAEAPGHRAVEPEPPHSVADHSANDAEPSRRRPGKDQAIVLVWVTTRAP